MLFSDAPMPICDIFEIRATVAEARSPQLATSSIVRSELRRKPRRAQRRTHRVLQELHDHRRPGAAAVPGAALDEDLLHHAREAQRHAESAPEFHREARV